MVNLKKNISFFKVSEGVHLFPGGGGGGGGSNFFQGVRVGPTFSRGGRGSNCLFPIETQITCDFPWGVRPLWIRTWYLVSQSA